MFSRSCGPKAALGLTFALAMLTSAHAEGLPGGTWQSSCYDAEVDHGTMTALCTDKRNREVEAEIDLTNCNANVRNDNGRLRCYGTPTNFPDGGWSQSCSDAYIAQNVLYAYCEDRRGREREASVRLNNCPNVENDNGRLICGTMNQPPTRPMPTGAWTQTCRNAQISGSVLRAECQNERRRWRDTEIDLNTCPSNHVENMDGRLTCQP